MSKIALKISDFIIPCSGPRLLLILDEFCRMDRILTPLLNVLDTALASDALAADTDDKQWLHDMFHLVAKVYAQKYSR